MSVLTHNKPFNRGVRSVICICPIMPMPPTLDFCLNCLDYNTPKIALGTVTITFITMCVLTHTKVILGLVYNA